MLHFFDNEAFLAKFCSGIWRPKRGPLEKSIQETFRARPLGVLTWAHQNEDEPKNKGNPKNDDEQNMDDPKN